MTGDFSSWRFLQISMVQSFVMSGIHRNQLICDNLRDGFVLLLLLWRISGNGTLCMSAKLSAAQPDFGDQLGLYMCTQA